jgi:hypothetical protein
MIANVRHRILALTLGAMLAIMVTVFGLVLLAGCGSDIDSGYVTKRVYHEPWTQVSSVCVMHDKNGFCTMRIPNNIYHPAEYELDLKDGKKTGWVYVDVDTFARFQVGMHYPDPR